MFRYENLFATIALLLFVTAGSLAQSTTGQIAGTVTDANGAVIPGATVKATNQATNYSRETATDGDGIYGFQLLPPGRYQVEVTATSFSDRKSVV